MLSEVILQIRVRKWLQKTNNFCAVLTPLHVAPYGKNYVFFWVSRCFSCSV